MPHAFLGKRYAAFLLGYIEKNVRCLLTAWPDALLCIGRCTVVHTGMHSAAQGYAQSFFLSFAYGMSFCWNLYNTLKADIPESGEYQL